MQTYRNVCTSDEEIVVQYLWNQSLSEALYPTLCFLEVALRNAMHRTLSANFSPMWFPNIFKGEALRDYCKMVSRLTTARGGPPTDGQIVANLTFGKWVHLLPNGKCKWVHQAPYPLFLVFPNYPSHAAKERNKIHEHLEYILALRNRVMHHEPIFDGVRIPNKPVKSIEQVHTDILSAIGWIDADLEKTARHVDRFDAVFRSGKAEILTNLPARLATL